jgi:predicted ribosome quality control (RQC) complex YloA/Tae2 family protein
MYDWLTARAVAAELNEKIAGGRVQAVVPLNGLALGFEIYAHHARHYLYASAETSEARAHLVAEKLRASLLPPSGFVQLARKYLDAALVNRIACPDYERIVEVEFDHHELGVTTLVVEVMGRHSNVILLDAGRVILDAIKRVTPEQSRVRPVQPGQMYQPPPAQNKIRPNDLTPAQLERIVAADPQEALADLLTRHVAGVSPLLANELVFRAHGELAMVLTHLRSILAAPSSPTLAMRGDEAIACAPYALTHLPDTRGVESISAALEEFYGREESYESIKETLRQNLGERREKLVRKRTSLERQLRSPEQIEKLKTFGDLILTFGQNKPGQRELRAGWGDGQTYKIALDPKLGASDNAQKYFDDYRRAKSAAEKLPAEIEKVDDDLAYLDQLLADIEIAETRADVDQALNEVVEAGFYRTTRQRPRGSTPPLGPRQFVSRDGFKILVGRNARQNDEVTFRLASGEDVWLHARGVGGSHVVIVTGGKTISDETIREAAALAAYYSQARSEAQADVTFTLRKNVHKPRRAPPGLVTLREGQTVRVAPATPAGSDT